MKEYSFGELIEWKSGNTPSMQNKRYWGGGTPWISGKEIKEKYIEDSSLKLTEEGLESGATLSKINDLLLLVRGQIIEELRVGICKSQLAFNQDIKSISIKNDLLDHEYLYYLIRGNEKKILQKVELTGLGAQKIDSNVSSSATPVSDNPLSP